MANAGRWVDVPPERLTRWIAGFDERHRVVRTEIEPSHVRLTGADTALAECHPPFPPLAVATPVTVEGLAPDALVDHACAERTVGVLLVRAGGHAAGVFEGVRLVASKVGSRLVHGRHSAGGSSQGRFQRRRAGQLRVAYAAAADNAARVLLPHIDRMDAVVCGGDRRAVAAVGEDPRLRPVFALATERFLTVPDPRLNVLRATPEQFRSVRIRVVDPPVGSEEGP